MLYAIGEIVLFLLVAAVLGFAIGWLLRGLRLRREYASELRALRAKESQRGDMLKAQLDRCRQERDAAAGSQTAANT